MKKILNIFLSFILFSSMYLSLNISSVDAAPGANLVRNPGFENGVTANWTGQATVTLAESTQAASGSKACHALGRAQAWSSPLQDMTADIREWGPGDYIVSAYVKIDGNTQSDNMLVVLNVTYDMVHEWKTAQGTVNNQSYTKIQGTVKIDYGYELANCILYLQSSEGTVYNYFCDDFSIQKANGIKEPITPAKPEPTDPVADRPDKTLVGAIRWDAWLNPSLKTFNAPGSSSQDYIGAQMARNLSPTQYHFRMPYFGIVLNKEKITFPDYSQPIFDQEMLYAKEAGIDYFMYCWYDDGTGMDSARRFHETSKYRNDVKMSAMWDITAISDAKMKYYTDYLHESYWQKVAGGRPLLYINQGNNQTVYGVRRFREACKAAGLKNPYLVGIKNFGSTAANVKQQGLDALSDYAIGGGGANPFSYLMDTSETIWNTDLGSGVQYIPLVTTGWDRRPRIDNPVTWEGPTADKNGYIQTAEPYEIARLLQKALALNKANPGKTNINSVLIYAWNEHDEGGWLCPTIVDDDRDGLPQKKADGSNVRDTRRLQAIAKVLKPGSSWTLDKDVVLTPAPTASASGSGSKAGSQAGSNPASGISAGSAVSNGQSSQSDIETSETADVSASASSAIAGSSGSASVNSDDLPASGNDSTGSKTGNDGKMGTGWIIFIVVVLLAGIAGLSYFLYMKNARRNIKS
ncbi:MAG: carbohydrate binding domain-containing protein [Saccharofermentanales bacterium]